MRTINWIEAVPQSEENRSNLGDQGGPNQAPDLSLLDEVESWRSLQHLAHEKSARLQKSRLNDIQRVEAKIQALQKNLERLHRWAAQQKKRADETEADASQTLALKENVRRVEQSLQELQKELRSEGEAIRQETAAVISQMEIDRHGIRAIEDWVRSFAEEWAQWKLRQESELPKRDELPQSQMGVFQSQINENRQKWRELAFHVSRVTKVVNQLVRGRQGEQKTTQERMSAMSSELAVVKKDLLETTKIVRQIEEEARGNGAFQPRIEEETKRNILRDLKGNLETSLQQRIEVAFKSFVRESEPLLTLAREQETLRGGLEDLRRALAKSAETGMSHQSLGASGRTTEEIGQRMKGPLDSVESQPKKGHQSFAALEYNLQVFQSRLTNLALKVEKQGDTFHSLQKECSSEKISEIIRKTTAEMLTGVRGTLDRVNQDLPTLRGELSAFQRLLGNHSVPQALAAQNERISALEKMIQRWESFEWRVEEAERRASLRQRDDAERLRDLGLILSQRVSGAYEQELRKVQESLSRSLEERHGETQRQIQELANLSQKGERRSEALQQELGEVKADAQQMLKRLASDIESSQQNWKSYEENLRLLSRSLERLARKVESRKTDCSSLQGQIEKRLEAFQKDIQQLSNQYDQLCEAYDILGQQLIGQTLKNS